MQEVHDGVAAWSGKINGKKWMGVNSPLLRYQKLKKQVKKLHSLLRTKKHETKKRKSICELKTIISFCIVFFPVFSSFLFFSFWVGWLLHIFHFANSLSPRAAPCFPFPNGKCRPFHTSRSRP